MPGSDGSGVIRLPAFLYLSYERQRRAIWLSYDVTGTSCLLGLLRKPLWPRLLLMPHIRKSRFANCSMPFSPLSAMCSMPLSATGCDGLQRKPRTFAAAALGHTNAIDE